MTPAANVFEAWSRAKLHLEPALPELHGTHTLDDIALMVGAGHFKLWLGERCALLTEITHTPRIKAVNCFLGGGDKDELFHLRDAQVIPWAKAQGCVRVTGAGRKGWLRALPGFTWGGVYMHKDI